MVDTGRGRRLVDRFGDQPGPYAVAAVALTLLWLPARLWFDRGDPLGAIIALSGLYGAVWAGLPLASDWAMTRRARKDTAAGRERRLPPESTPASARRGALVGLVVGVPFASGFALFSLLTGRWPGYPILFAAVGAGIVLAAVRRLRHAGA